MAMYINGKWQTPGFDTYVQYPKPATGQPGQATGQPRPLAPPRAPQPLLNQAPMATPSVAGAPRTSGNTSRPAYQPPSNATRAISTPGSRGGQPVAGNVRRYGDGGSTMQGGGVGSTGGTGHGPLANLPAVPGGYATAPTYDPGQVAGGGGGRTPRMLTAGTYTYGPGGTLQTANPYVNKPLPGKTFSPGDLSAALPTPPPSVGNLNLGRVAGNMGIHTGPATNSRIPGAAGGGLLPGVGGLEPVFNDQQVNQMAGQAAEPVLRAAADARRSAVDASARGGYVNPAHLAAMNADAEMSAAGAVGAARRDATLAARGTNAQQALAGREQDIAQRGQDVAQVGQNQQYNLGLGEQALQGNAQQIGQRDTDISAMTNLLTSQYGQQWYDEMARWLSGQN